MKITKLLIILLVLFLSSCKQVDVPIDVDCNVTPTHESCVVDEVDCDVTPEHEDCVEEVVDVVDCDLTPEHSECIVEEPEVIESCEVRGITDCPFILAEAFYDGSFVDISSYDVLREADSVLEESSNPNIVILWDDKVMGMKYGAINFKTKSISEITLLAPLDFGKATYLNGNYNVDGLFLDNNNIFVKGIVAGVEFEILVSEVELIPHVQTRNGYSYYTNINSELVHKISASIKQQSYWTIGPIDQAPSYLDLNERYYSYDNHYFYTDIFTMTDDINNGHRDNSVNSDSPYYNYYQYLSFRSKTNYTALELDSYLDSKVTSSSVLKDSGQDFINAQDDVFINATLELAFAIHESGWETSSIARDKLNLFGINAVDGSPYDSAATFISIEECIEYHVGSFLQTRYFNGNYSVAFGTNLGNKYQGMNYKYASDAYWGEKIASYYYDMDKYLGFKDNNYYKIVLLDFDTIGYFGPQDGSPVVYDSSDYNYYGLLIPFVVMRETDDFYVLQNPLGYNDLMVMDPFEIMSITDVFYVAKEDAIPIN